jgi:hypothetical protein
MPVASYQALQLVCALAPMYVSETPPKAIRGALTTCFNLILLISLYLAFWINVSFNFQSFFSQSLSNPSQYGVSVWTHPSEKQWRIPMAIQMITGGLLLIRMIFQKGSPWYLISYDRQDETIQTLTYNRQLPANHPFVAAEIAEITQSVMIKKAAVEDHQSSVIKDIFTIPANRRRYLLAITVQIFQQMTGTNAINYFAPSIFASVGLTGTSTSLLATGVYGIVKVCTTLVYVFLIVDNVGRQKPLITGALIQACYLLYLTVVVK